MQIQFVGSGDAFGSGGRFNTCIHLKGDTVSCLIDCGSSSLIALKQIDLSPNTIDTILITHFHADHFGGVPFLVLDAQFNSKRESPLTIAGPPGLSDWFVREMETSFPGSSKVQQRFAVSLVEVAPERQTDIGALKVTSYPVQHGMPGEVCFAYRVEAEGRVISYTGDTEWTDRLLDAGNEADLFIAEAYFYEKAVRYHLDFARLKSKLPLVNAKRVVLTHMSHDMLIRLSEVSYETASDGRVFKL